jgi:Tfp pilus assembly protein PilN
VSYNRIEINLLPPELRPGPAVRYALVINFLVIAVTIAYLAVDSLFGMSRITSLHEDKTAVEQQIRDGQQVVADHQRLVLIHQAIVDYGKLIGMASANYVDMPVVLDRLARVMPDGVYLRSISNDKAAEQPGGANLVISLSASRRDPALLLETLRAFKGDPVFENCYMRFARFQEESLDQFLQRVGVNWSTTGPGIDDTLLAEQFEFDIHTRISTPIADLGLPVVQDDSVYFAEASLESPPREPRAEDEAGPVEVDENAASSTPDEAGEGR